MIRATLRKSETKKYLVKQSIFPCANIWHVRTNKFRDIRIFIMNPFKDFSKKFLSFTIIHFYRRNYLIYFLYFQKVTHTILFSTFFQELHKNKTIFLTLIYFQYHYPIIKSKYMEINCGKSSAFSCTKMS